TEALFGHRQQQPDVAPAQLDQPEQTGHVRAVSVAVALRLSASRAVRATRAVRAATDRAGTGAAQRAALVHALDHGGKHVELLGVGVLGLVVLTRVRAEDLGGDLVGL